MYGAMYSPQLAPAGVWKRLYSLSAQRISACPVAVVRRPPTRYVKGEMRYMNIQKPGRDVFVTMTLEGY